MNVTFRLVVAFIYLFIFAPLVVVVLVSFNGGTVASFPIETWSLRWYHEAIDTRSFTSSAMTSLWLATSATIIAVPIALFAAIGITRYEFPGKSALEGFLMAPILVPGIVIGIAILLSFTTLQIRGAPMRLLAAHVLIAFPYCLRTILASLSRLDGSLIEAARTLGASNASILWNIILPLVKPGIVAGAIFAFLQSFGDVPISLFLTDARNNTLPLAIMSYLEYNVDPTVAAISSIVIIGSLFMALTIERLAGLRRAFSG